MPSLFGGDEGNKRNRLIYLLLGLMLVLGYAMLVSPIGNKSIQTIPVSSFIHKIQNGEVVSASLQNEYGVVYDKNGDAFMSKYPFYYSPKVIEELLKSDAAVSFDGAGGDASKVGTFFGIFGQIISWLPLILMLWFWYRIFQSSKGDGGGKGKSGSGGIGGIFSSGAFGFGRSRAKIMLSASEIKVRFDDVAGIDESKRELSEIVDFLKSPSKYSSIGGKIPKGCMLIGEPGTGKTMLAKAVAGEAGVPFFFVSGSDFVEMFVGVGASRIRDMFAQAKKHSPCIVFIDEIDAVGRQRGHGIGGGNDEREQTLNQMLVEMDGFEDNSGVVVIAATNRADVLDRALLRPGRFDRQVYVPIPDIIGREQILKVHMKNVKIGPDVDIQKVARSTPGFSGADLANLVNESALHAARFSKRLVTRIDFEEARDKITMGNTRKIIMSEEEKRLTAYHESGHAIVSMMLKDSDPVHKITIIPRGHTLGLVMRLPERDAVSKNISKILADISVAMGGRLAEEIFFGPDKVTTGAMSDIKYITDLARNMVLKWGMSEKVGTVFFGENRDNIRYGVDESLKISSKKLEEIDSEIGDIIKKQTEVARSIILKNRKNLENLASRLLVVETLTGDEAKDIIDGKYKEDDLTNKNTLNKESSKISASRFSVPNKGQKANKENTKLANKKKPSSSKKSETTKKKA